jgi:hypothetical protein
MMYDGLLHRGVDVILGEILGGPCSGRGRCGRGDRGRSGGGVVLGGCCRRRWSHLWRIRRGLVGGPQRRRNSKAQRCGNRRGACDRGSLTGKIGETLPLEFVEIHQPVRHLKKEGEYFACTDFRKPGSQDEYYDIDFWVNQKTGKLQVDNVNVHKVPVQEDGVWTQVPRYTFDGMDIEETN